MTSTMFPNDSCGISSTLFSSITRKHFYLYTIIILVFNILQALRTIWPSRKNVGPLQFLHGLVAYWTKSTSFLLLALIPATSMFFFHYKIFNLLQIFPKLRDPSLRTFQLIFHIFKLKFDISKLFGYLTPFILCTLNL